MKRKKQTGRMRVVVKATIRDSGVCAECIRDSWISVISLKSWRLSDYRVYQNLAKHGLSVDLPG
jgi:hypothetical protein